MNRKQAIKEAKEYLMFNKDKQKALNILKTVYPIHRQAENRLKKLLTELYPKDNDWKHARKTVQLVINKEVKHIELVKLPMDILHRVFLILNKKNLWSRW